MELVQQFLRKLCSDEQGQTIVEYGLILTFIALVLIAVLGSLGTSVINIFTSVSGGF